MNRLMPQLLFILLLVFTYRRSAHFYTQNVWVKEEFVVEKLQQVCFESEQFVIVLLLKNYNTIRSQWSCESLVFWPIVYSIEITWKRKKKRVVPLFMCNKLKSI